MLDASAMIQVCSSRFVWGARMSNDLNVDMLETLHDDGVSLTLIHLDRERWRKICRTNVGLGILLIEACP